MQLFWFVSLILFIQNPTEPHPDSKTTTHICVNPLANIHRCGCHVINFVHDVGWSFLCMSDYPHNRDLCQKKKFGLLRNQSHICVSIHFISFFIRLNECLTNVYLWNFNMADFECFINHSGGEELRDGTRHNVVGSWSLKRMSAKSNYENSNHNSFHKQLAAIPHVSNAWAPKHHLVCTSPQLK